MSLTITVALLLGASSFKPVYSKNQSLNNKNNQVINDKKVDYLELAENYEEEILSSIRMRTMKPYYNAPLLKLDKFGTSLETKNLNFKDSIKKPK